MNNAEDFESFVIITIKDKIILKPFDCPFTDVDNIFFTFADLARFPAFGLSLQKFAEPHQSNETRCLCYFKQDH
jgi:hypothetical protein